MPYTNNSMSNKLISIILPVYNVEKYIHKSIQSVLNQTYTNFELLVINDGTPDNSIKLVEAFDDSRIKIYHKENGGLSDARNFGLEKAQGDFIYFMDSDDWIEPNLIEDSILALENNKTDIVIFGYHLDTEDANGNMISSSKVISDNNLFIKNINPIIFEKETLGLMGYAWNKMYRTSLLKDNNIVFKKGTSLVEDILFNTEVFCNTDKLLFIDKAYYHYLNRPVSTLIKKFHANSFELKLEKNYSIKSFMNNWEVNNDIQNELLSISLIGGIRYTLHNMFSYKNNLSNKEKIEFIKQMLGNTETKELIKYYKPISNKDKIYKILIKYNCTNTIYAMNKFIK